MCSGFQRNIEGKRGRCTKCKSDGNYNSTWISKSEPSLGLLKYQLAARRTPFLASLYGFQANHDR